jgi:hypothetical protein
MQNFRRLLGPNGEKITKEWRVLHNERLQNIIKMVKSRRMKWAKHAVNMGKTRNAYYEVLVRRPEGKSPLRRPRTKWEETSN